MRPRFRPLALPLNLHSFSDAIGHGAGVKLDPRVPLDILERILGRIALVNLSDSRNQHDGAWGWCVALFVIHAALQIRARQVQKAGTAQTPHTPMRTGSLVAESSCLSRREELRQGNNLRKFPTPRGVPVLPAPPAQSQAWHLGGY